MEEPTQLWICHLDHGYGCRSRGGERLKTMKETPMKTIKMTDRPPIRINEGQWPYIGGATESTHDGEHRCQAVRTTEVDITVRRHADGRTLVYGTFDHDTCMRGERNGPPLRWIPGARSGRDCDSDQCGRRPDRPGSGVR